MYKQNFELDTPAALRVIANLTNDELKELLNDDEKFEEVIKNVEQVRMQIFFIVYYKTKTKIIFKIIII